MQLHLQISRTAKPASTPSPEARAKAAHVRSCAAVTHALSGLHVRAVPTQLGAARWRRRRHKRAPVTHALPAHEVGHVAGVEERQLRPAPGAAAHARGRVEQGRRDAGRARAAPGTRRRPAVRRAADVAAHRLRTGRRRSALKHHLSGPGPVGRHRLGTLRARRARAAPREARHASSRARLRSREAAPRCRSHFRDVRRLGKLYGCEPACPFGPEDPSVGHIPRPDNKDAASDSSTSTAATGAALMPPCTIRPSLPRYRRTASIFLLTGCK